MTEEKKYLPATLAGPAPKPFQITTLEDAQKMGQLFVEAGLFEVTDKEAQQGMTAAKKAAIATVKVVAGASMGISPFAAMRGLHVVRGKVEPGYQTLLALLKKHGYSYKIHKREIDGASIEFFGRDGKSLGVSTHDKEDQAREGLGGDNWRKYPRQMHLARAVRAGADAWCSEVLDSPVSTGNDAEFDEVIEAEGFEVEEQTSTPKQSAASANESKKSTQKPAASTASTKQASSESKPTQKPADAPAAAESAAKSQDTTPEAAGTKTTTEEEIEEAETVDEIQEASDGEVPGQAQLDEILQTGTSNGWSEEQIEEWLIPFLVSKGVDVSNSTESIFLTWTFEIVIEAINHLANNKPGA